MLGLEIVFTPLALTPKTFPVGSTVRVTVSFKYTAGVNLTAQLKAAPYYTNVTGKHLVASCAGVNPDVSLAATSTPASKTAAVDFRLTPKAQGGIEDGTYGLRVWIEGAEAVADADNVLVVSGNPATGWGSLLDMLPLLIMVLVMSMMTSMMKE